MLSCLHISKQSSGNPLIMIFIKSFKTVCSISLYLLPVSRMLPPQSSSSNALMMAFFCSFVILAEFLAINRTIRG